MLRTRLCELLSIELPVLGAPMGPEIASLELAAAVSNAGGLGMISFGGYGPVALKERIRKLRTLTSKPFGVNVILGGPHLPLPESAFVDACLEELVPVLSFFWGDCTPYVERAHKLGLKVCDQVGSVSAAKRAQRAGVDFIIAQGVEAGGHVAGTVGSMVLVPRIADSVVPVPVIAAGGIADGRGLAAALALGAQGVVLGTRLLAAAESNTHEVYRNKILAATEEDTVRTTLFGNEWPNAPHRTLRTPFVDRWLSEEKRGSEQRADEPIVGTVSFGGNRVPLRRFAGIPPASDAVGDVESMDFLAGQAVGLVEEIKPAAEIIREVAAQAEHTLAVTHEFMHYPEALREETSRPVCASLRVSQKPLAKSAGETPRKDNAKTGLQERLDDFKKAFESGAPPYNVPNEAIELMHRGTAELKASGIEGAALRVGDRAPSFTLFNQDHVQVASSDLLREGPLVVSFFRGHW